MEAKHSNDSHNRLTPTQLEHYNKTRNIASSVAQFFSQVHDVNQEHSAYFSNEMIHLFQSINDCEKAEIAPAVIKTAIIPVIELYTSDFATRLKEWPRGYAGDFETIDHLYYRRNNHPHHSIKWMIDEYIYSSPIAQQHRNKISHQAKIISDAITNNNDARIAVLACGSGIDLKLIENVIINSNCTIYIIDQDQNAIDFTSKRCREISHKFIPVTKDVVSVMKMLSHEQPLDLIVAGGLFDYLRDKSSIFIINRCYQKLKTQSKFLFTNISDNNPYRFGMEYILNWKLIMRSKEDINRLCTAAGIPLANVSIKSEETGLTYLIELLKKP